MLADWDNLALGVFYSSNDAVTDLPQNLTASLSATGQRDLLKVCRSDELGSRVFSHALYEKLPLVDLNGARQGERCSALHNIRRDDRGPLLLRCLYREGGQGCARNLEPWTAGAVGKVLTDEEIAI